jgi:hypothetical protein
VLALWIACIGVVLPVLLLGLCMVRVKPVRVDRPGNLGGSDSWEDAGSWRHSGSIRRKELRERAVKMVFEIRERDGKGQGSWPGSGGSWVVQAACIGRPARGDAAISRMRNPLTRRP